MAIITEDFVSFETAKLLKEKNCPDFGYSCICDSEGNKAQTQSIIMKWLREVHNLQIIIIPIRTKQYKNWTFEIYKEFNSLTIDVFCFSTYEQAVEAAIKYCLEHLI